MSDLLEDVRAERPTAAADDRPTTAAPAGPPPSRRLRPPRFVAAVTAEELCADPSLLSVWCDAFTAGYPTTLRIMAAGDPAMVENDVLQAMASVGIAGQDPHDLELRICSNPADIDDEIADSAQAVLTRRRLRGDLASMAATSDVAVLRTLAVTWWTR